MKEVLSVFMKRLIMGLGVITLAIGSMLAANGTVELIGALIIGFVTGLVFLGNMSMRLWKAASLSAGNAKRQMLWGLVLRLQPSRFPRRCSVWWRWGLSSVMPGQWFS